MRVYRGRFTAVPRCISAYREVAVFTAITKMLPIQQTRLFFIRRCSMHIALAYQTAPAYVYANYTPLYAELTCNYIAMHTVQHHWLLLNSNANVIATFYIILYLTHLQIYAS